MIVVQKTPPTGIEPVTLRLTASRSNQLSYGSLWNEEKNKALSAGIEPATLGLEVPRAIQLRHMGSLLF